MSGNGGAAVRPLRVALLLTVCCCLPLGVPSAGESGSRLRHRARSVNSQPHLFWLNSNIAVACMLINDVEQQGGGGGGGGGGTGSRGPSRLADRIANRRPTTRRPNPALADCPNGVTYFDGCNSCSCGTEQLCTLKACNADTTVQIFDPCSRITCGYHQRCQAICVGQVCQLKPLCVSDDSPDCHNCPWLCVNERLNCSDNFGNRGCKPTLACYKPNM